MAVTGFYKVYTEDAAKAAFATVDGAKRISPKAVPDSARGKGYAYDIVESYTGESHTGCSTTSGSSTFTDPSITTAFVGRAVSGTNIPAGAIVGTVNESAHTFTCVVGFTLLSTATGTGTGLTFTYAPLPDVWLTTVIGSTLMPDQVTAGKTWSHGASDPTRCYATFNGGQTLFPISPQVDQTAPATSITAVMPLPDGSCLFASSDQQSITVPSTKTFLYRTTDPATLEGRTIGQVATLDGGGYVEKFSFDVNTLNDYLVSVYGYKQDSSTTTPNLNARYVYHSTDGNIWVKTLDIGGYHNQHVHCPYIAPDGTGWVTTGDGDSGGTDTDALLDVNRRAIWYTPNAAARAAGTWQPVILLDPDDPTYRLQAVPITQFTAADGRTWMYCGEDNLTRGRIYRFDPGDVAAGNLTPPVEVVFDPAPQYANNQSNPPAGNTWTAPWYGMAVDPDHNIIYASSRSESASNRGRFMCSVDGINWVELWESGVTGDGPGASRWGFKGDYAWYGTRRFVRRQIVQMPGSAPRDLVVVTLRKDGTLSTQADQWVISPTVLGFRFRVVRFGLHVRVAPGTGSVSVTGRRGSGGASICRAGGDPSVAAGATVLSAAGTVLPGPGTLFSGPRGDELHIDLSAANGGTDATVFVALERISSVPVPTGF